MIPNKNGDELECLGAAGTCPRAPPRTPVLHYTGPARERRRRERAIPRACPGAHTFLLTLCTDREGSPAESRPRSATVSVEEHFTHPTPALPCNVFSQERRGPRRHTRPDPAPQASPCVGAQILPHNHGKGTSGGHRGDKGGGTHRGCGRTCK